ncbi:MAG: phage tail sheath family protein [Pseudonocardiaceae bacterium]
MPEYLTPGVYVEETSFRSKSIEGVPTSTFGMTGLARYGPVPHVLTIPDPGGGAPVVLSVALNTEPPLVTSFTEFERAFGDLGTVAGGPNYLALSARAFFANGGRRLYVSRVFGWARTAQGEIDPAQVDGFFARRAVTAGGADVAQWRARWPGAVGREIKVEVGFRRSKNVIVRGVDAGTGAAIARLTTVREFALVELAPLAAGGAPPSLPDGQLPNPANVRVVVRDPADGELKFTGADGSPEAIPSGQAGFHLQLSVTVTWGERIDVYNELAIDSRHPRSILKVLNQLDPADEFTLVWLRSIGTPAPAQLLAALLDVTNHGYLTGGSDGAAATPSDFEGEAADPDNVNKPATGLHALAEIDDIAIVAMPDTARFTDQDQAKTAVDLLIGHCERLRYRMAIVDPPPESSISEVRAFRSQFDTKYAALYYPWLEILDPNQRPDPGAPAPKLLVPPSGYVAGIYARSDIERGVHKAPANEVVLGITRFECNVTYDQQSVLNPEGINALRFFEGRSNRVWGARTMSSDPEWKYVNVRRLFIFLEHSIDKSTQWAVFEPNNERLWASIRQTIEDFLLVTWLTGALMGTKPEEAYFVRCDRTTMTQNDLDNGRLICLIGVAPTYPAEFVIFRIGQFTADARRS